MRLRGTSAGAAPRSANRTPPEGAPQSSEDGRNIVLLWDSVKRDATRIVGPFDWQCGCHRRVSHLLKNQAPAGDATGVALLIGSKISSWWGETDAGDTVP